MSRFLMLMTTATLLFLSQTVYAQDIGVVISDANIRNRPTTKSQIIRSVPEGTELEILDVVDGERIGFSATWYLIEHRGIEGYVHDSLITVIGETSPPPDSNSANDIYESYDLETNNYDGVILCSTRVALFSGQSLDQYQSRRGNTYQLEECTTEEFRDIFFEFKIHLDPDLPNGSTDVLEIVVYFSDNEVASTVTHIGYGSLENIADENYAEIWWREPYEIDPIAGFATIEIPLFWIEVSDENVLLVEMSAGEQRYLHS